MKKAICVLVGLMLMSGVVFGYTTWQEAMDSGSSKYSTGNYIGARVDWAEAMNLGTPEEKSQTQFYIGNSYIREQNYTQAVIEFQKVFDIFGGRPVDRWITQYHIFSAYENSSDKNGMMVSGVRFLSMEGLSNISQYTPMQLKEWVFKTMGSVDFIQAVTKFGTPPDWNGYYWRSRVKQLLKDWQGAYADLDTAYSLRPADNADVKKMILQEIEEVKMRL